MAPGQPANQNSQLARRLVLLFLLCALVPLLGGTVLAMRNYAADRAARDQAALRAQASSYGMALLGKLVAFDDALAAQVGPASRSPSARAEAARSLPWVASAMLVSPGQAGWPTLDVQQGRALARGNTLLVTGSGASPHLALLRPAGADTWLALEVRDELLWNDIADYAADGQLRVFDASGRLLASGDGRQQPGSGAGPAERAVAWTLFLGGRFNSPPWQVELWRSPPGLATLLSGTQLWLLATGVGTAVLIALLATRLVRRELQPFGQLVLAARRVSQRDFGTPVATDGEGEFGQLAQAFNSMSESLQRDFATLASLAEVDRQLLRSPSLEQILDALLPRIAEVLGSSAVSVVLVDPDAPGHVRAFDHVVGEHGPMRVRRLVVPEEQLRELAPAAGGPVPARVGPEAAVLVEPLRADGNTWVQCQPLGSPGLRWGLVCAARASSPQEPAAHGITLHDFADRLGVVMANLEQTRQLRQAAHYDPLTGLANRRLFSEELERAVGRAAHGGQRCALLYLDLDDFKRVNDTSGHVAGDELLRAVGARLQQAAGPHCLAARLGGDEFAILVPGLRNEGVLALCQQLQQVLQEPVVIGERRHQLHASIGVAIGPDDGHDAARLLMNGDIAMYRAKESGRGTIAFFEPAMQERLHERVALETGLHQALASGGLRVDYQPIVHGDNRGLCAVEALVRWPAAHGMPARTPAEFIPVAEECGLIVELGAWVLRTACADFEAWRKAGVALEYISVNVSTGQLHDPAFEENVAAALRGHGMAAAQLQLEVTESVIVEGDSVRALLGRLAARGIRIALDDFGTGYSSLSYLRQFPVHAIKIDRSFVDELPGSRPACRLVEAMLAMAHAVEVHAIAEGVETASQAQFLEAAGCEAMQGFLFSPAVQARALPALAQQLATGRAPRERRAGGAALNAAAGST